MVSKHQFERAPLTEMINQLALREKKKKSGTSDAKRKAKMNNPAESRPWAEYRGKHVKPGIIKNGVKFWNRHQQTLARAEQQYGVPAHIIMGVLGVETRYGGYMGKNPVINALATFAFNYPKRERFFSSELEEFLLLAREEKQDPFSYLGSYAGAMGMPQFMPSNYRKLAVDFDQDGKKDIWHTPADAIGSIANYLNHHGWTTGTPIATPARYQPVTPITETKVETGDSLWTIAKRLQSQNGGSMGDLMSDIQQLNPQAFVNNNPNQLMLGAQLKLPAAIEPGYRHLILKKLRPKFELSQILQQGFEIDPDYPADAKALLLELKGEKGVEHWIALHNFYVISKYNPRTLYTMAVFQLSEEIRKAYNNQSEPANAT
jgi:lytic murein transglycosylase B